MPLVKDNALVAPGGKSWNELQKIFPLLVGAQIVWAGSDPAGITLNEQKTELVIKLPAPKITGTAVCNGDGSITFTFTVE